MPKIIAGFQEQYPMVKIFLSEIANDELLLRIGNDALDICVGDISEERPDLLVEELYRERMMLVIPRKPAFRPLAEQQKKGLTVQVPEEVRGFVTRDGFTELVSILVDNAVKYCDDGGEVRVGLLKKGRGKGCHLRVSNAYAAGRGMDMSRFFDRFYRADQSHSSEKKGYGIGLSMAEGLAREFHGRIAAEYKNGVITFVVTLP